MLELLVACALASGLIVGAVAFMMQTQRAMNRVSQRSRAETQFDDLITGVQRQFFRRYIPYTGDPPAYQFLAGQPNQPAACQGLMIHQHVPTAANPKNVREVRIYTECATGAPLPQPANFMAGYAVNCGAGTRPRVRLQVFATMGGGLGPTTEAFTPPPNEATFAAALCFTNAGNSVAAEGGGLYKLDQNVLLFQKKISLVLNDKNQLVELIR